MLKRKERKERVFLHGKSLGEMSNSAQSSRKKGRWCFSSLKHTTRTWTFNFLPFFFKKSETERWIIVPLFCNPSIHLTCSLSLFHLVPSLYLFLYLPTYGRVLDHNRSSSWAWSRLLGDIILLTEWMKEMPVAASIPNWVRVNQASESECHN